MQIVVNGEPHEVAEQTSVQQLLEILGVTAGRVAVEVNLDVIRQPDRPQTFLNEGDKVEIVAFIGGG